MDLIDSVEIPGDGGSLGLYRRGSDYFIKILGGQDLMNSRAHGSEDALGAIPCKAIRDREKARALIGGLGMGFTLAAALNELGSDAEVVVAELVPGVVEWNRGELGASSGYPLRDPRVRVEEVDVADILARSSEVFDAVVLDVDNGPDGLTRASNGRLYSRAGLRGAFDALRPGGVLAVWSAGPDRAFTKRLRSVGFAVDEVSVRAHAGKGARHLIWVGRKG